MNLAVTGATGHLGRLVIERLKTRLPNSELIALARDLSKVADLGVPTRTADYDRPETLAAALAGVDRLVLISASMIGQRVSQHHNVIEAAKRAGVKRIVYTSLLHADRSPLGLAEEHRASEAELQASGIPFTILRNVWYIENYTDSMAATLAHGALIGSAGDGKISGAARSDYAEAAVVAATDEAHVGKVYELAGDEAFTMAALAAEISRQSGKTIPYRNLTAADYAQALVSAGVSATFAQTIAGWDVSTALGALFDDGRQLSKLIGRPTTSLAAVVAEQLTTLS